MAKERKSGINPRPIQNALKAFAELEDVSAQNDKIAVIKENAGNLVFRRLLSLALDPMIPYFVGEQTIPVSQVEPPKQPDLIQNFTTFRGLARALNRRMLTGRAAYSALETLFNDCSEEERVLYRRILLKDLRAGVGVKLANKAVPGLIQTFDIMLCDKYNEKKLTFPRMAEVKLDGYRCVARFEDNNVALFSRNGTSLGNFPLVEEELVSTLRGTSGVWFFDGEIMSPNGFQGAQSQVFRKENVDTGGFKYYVFDLVCSEDFYGIAKEPAPYTMRKALLENVLRQRRQPPEDRVVHLVRSVEINDLEDMYKEYVRARKRGYEGLVLKDPEGVYVQKRSSSWMKVKADSFGDCIDEDLQVVKFLEGKDKYRGTLGAFVVAFRGTHVRVGTGLTDEERAMFWTRHKEDPKYKPIIRVIAQEVTPDGSLRFPRFICERDDLETK